MKKILSLILIFLLALSGCSKNNNTEQLTTTPAEQGDIVISQTESEIVLRNTDDWMTAGLKQVGLDGFTQNQVEEGNLQTSSGSEKYKGVILSSFYDEVVRTSYIAVVLGDKVIIKPFIKNVQASYDDIIYLRDIDGDKTDDIILQSAVGMTGGAGSYVSQVYRVTENGIEQVFYNSSSDPFDVGFVGVISPDYKMKVSNASLNYEIQFDYLDRQYLDGTVFDDSDETTDDVLWIDSFYSFIPTDIDNDGVYEIEGVQYSCVFWHSNYIGDIKTVLEYDSTTNSFVVIDGSFEEKVGYSDSQISEIATFEGSVDELNQKYPIDHFRENGNVLEIFYSSGRKVAVLYCESDEVVLGKLHTIDTLKSDFDDLSIGDSIDVVKEISPDGDFSFLYTGRDDMPKISYHYTRDGYEVAVSYDENMNVAEVTFDLVY